MALDDDRLACVYQPKIDLRSGQVVGVEVLLRWHHPELGDVPPAWFLPLVERTALIRPLTLHVLDLALAQSARWRCGGRDTRTVSVNLSATNLLDPSLPQEMARLLARHAVPPDRLMVEVTESVFVGDAERTAQVIGDLTRLGVRLSVDDYGTGFSALHRVRTVATEELKLDSSFIHGAVHRPDLQTIVRATALLAHGLDLVLGRGGDRKRRGSGGGDRAGLRPGSGVSPVSATSRRRTGPVAEAGGFPHPAATSGGSAPVTHCLTVAGPGRTGARRRMSVHPVRQNAAVGRIRPSEPVAASPCFRPTVTSGWHPRAVRRHRWRTPQPRRPRTRHSR